MRVLTAALFLILCSANVAAAVQIRATWQLNDQDEAIENYILYERTETGAVELLRVDGQTSEALHEHTGDCKTYLLTAARGDLESHPAVAVFCPPSELPPIYVRPGQPLIFNINIQAQ